MAKKKAASTAGVERTTLAAHLRRIEKSAKQNATSGKERGACLVTNPQTGQNQCIRTDAATCKALKGTFIGGPCGGMG